MVSKVVEFDVAIGGKADMHRRHARTRIMSFCYRIERLIVVLSPMVPLHSGAEAMAFDKHKFKTEMDDEARRAMFGHLIEKDQFHVGYHLED